MIHTRRILGLDPSLVACGWGIVEQSGSKLRHISHGVVKPPKSAPLSDRLLFLSKAIERLLTDFQPDCAAVEEAFMKNNAMSALKLGHARAVCLLAPASIGLTVGEYAPRAVKKAVVGTGGAEKSQVAAMINLLLPGAKVSAGDAADALAVAVCHAHHAPFDLNAALKAAS